MRDNNNIVNFTINTEILTKLGDLSKTPLEDITKADRKILDVFVMNDGTKNAAFELINYIVANADQFQYAEVEEYFTTLFNAFPSIARSKNTDDKTFLEYLLVSELTDAHKFAILLEALRAGALLSRDILSQESKVDFKKLFEVQEDNMMGEAEQDLEINNVIFAILTHTLDTKIAKHLTDPSSSVGILGLDARFKTQEFYKKINFLSIHDEIRALSALIDGVEMPAAEDFDLNNFILRNKNDDSERNLLHASSFSKVNLTFATLKDLKIAISILLDTGADLEEKDEENCTPLANAISENNSTETDSFTHRTLIKALVDSGANVSSLNGGENSTPLHFAADGNDTHVIDILVEAGADVNAVDRDGETPLHAAANYCKTNIVNSLIAAGANVNIQDTDGATPLHNAVEKGASDIIRLLVAAGAHVDIQNNEHATPIDLAQQRNNLEVLAALGVKQPQASFNPTCPVRTRDTKPAHANAFKPYDRKPSANSVDSILNSTSASATQQPAFGWNSGIAGNTNQFSGAINAQTRALPPLQSQQPAFGWNSGIAGNTNQFSGAINAQTRALPPLQAPLQTQQQFVTPSFQQQPTAFGDMNAYNNARAQAQHFVPQQHSFGYTPYTAAAPQQYFGQPTTVNNTFNFNGGVNNIGSNVYNNGVAPQPQQPAFNNGSYASNYRDNVQKEGNNYENKDSNSDWMGF